MEGRRSSMKKRLSGSMGDLSLATESRRTFSFQHNQLRRVNFSSTYEVREFNTFLSPATVGFGSLERLVQGETSQTVDANGLSPFVNQAIRTNQNRLELDDMEHSYNLSMSLSLGNVSVASQQSREKTNSSIRDMSSVEELRTWGNDDDDILDNLPGSSSQALAFYKPSLCKLKPTVTVRNNDVVRHPENLRRNPMVFNPPTPVDFLNPFGVMNRSSQLKDPLNKLSFGRFGFSKTPSRNISPSTLPPQQLQQHQKVKLTYNDDAQSSPMLPAPPLIKTTSDVGFNCTLCTCDSNPVTREPGLSVTGSVATDTSSTLVKAPPHLIMDSCDKEAESDCEGSYSHSDMSSSILDVSTHEEEPSNCAPDARDSRPASLMTNELELPATGSLAAGASSTLVKAPTPLIMKFCEHESDCEESCSSSEMSLSVLAISTHSEDESSSCSLQSSPPSVISESEECFEESFEFNGNVDMRIEEIGSNSSCSDSVHTTITSDIGEGDRRDSASHEDENVNEESHEGENEDNGTVEPLGEQLEEFVVEEDGEEVEGEIGLDEQDGIDLVEMEKNQGEVEVRSDVSNEQSHLSQQFDRSQNADGLLVGEGFTPATISVNSDSDTASPRRIQPPIQVVAVMNENPQASSDVRLHVTAIVSVISESSDVFKELFETLNAYSVDHDLDIYAKWEFLNSVTDKLSRLAEPEWKALLQVGTIKDFMGDNYVKAVEVHRQRFLIREPLFRDAMNSVRPQYFPDWARN